MSINNLMSGTSRPTIKDVAEAADVSFKTVSRVVNREPGVSEVLAERVNEAIKALGYQRDDRAKSLRRRDEGSSTIGFAHADIANPFFAAVHDALEQVATDQGFLILTGTCAEDAERQSELIGAFARRRVDGLVVVPAGPGERTDSTALRAEIELGTPVVFIDREPELPGDVVLSDHRGGAQQAAEHLMARGHQNIAFIGDQKYLFSAAERRIGFEAAVAASDSVEATIITDIDSLDAAERTTIELMQRPRAERPTALFTAQNYITLGAVRALHNLGLQHEVALVGFDDLSLADVIEPGLTVVAQNPEEVGRRAGALLFRRISGLTGGSVREIVPVSLICRGSGEIVAVA
jgi:LacI family transcriptional regulator